MRLNKRHPYVWYIEIKCWMFNVPIIAHIFVEDITYSKQLFEIILYETFRVLLGVQKSRHRFESWILYEVSSHNMGRQVAESNDLSTLISVFVEHRLYDNMKQLL